MSQIVYVGGYSTPDRRGVADGVNVYRIDDGGRWRHCGMCPALTTHHFCVMRRMGRPCVRCMGGVPT